MQRELKKKTNLKVGITGMTSDFKLADNFLKKKFIDSIFIGRPFLSNPFFLYKDKYLSKNGFKKKIKQYSRGF